MNIKFLGLFANTHCYELEIDGSHVSISTVEIKEEAVSLTPPPRSHLGGVSTGEN